jgi:hypothetical protein
MQFFFSQPEAAYEQEKAFSQFTRPTPCTNSGFALMGSETLLHQWGKLIANALRIQQ